MLRISGSGLLSGGVARRSVGTIRRTAAAPAEYAYGKDDKNYDADNLKRALFAFGLFPGGLLRYRLELLLGSALSNLLIHLRRRHVCSFGV